MWKSCDLTKGNFFNMEVIPKMIKLGQISSKKDFFYIRFRIDKRHKYQKVDLEDIAKIIDCRDNVNLSVKRIKELLNKKIENWTLVNRL